ncbi:hypothetical protein IQ268_19115 [Oculatella sp. LEGE 06141]|uniref:hypothetical protein n=1 Tax=Oculatella sp. LEGE 06141 TaxID=1828648 RepID=UPI00187FC4B0|nr:hypothetical protein [Oculatella sp. LEGE 06141]MBE9180673.1 hypothetical protein [Oculatella sp. LEGE 06141]
MSSNRINPTVVLTLGLLFLMIVAGIVSASWGYSLGRQALKGITQPDVRPNSGVDTSSDGSTARREEFTLLREDDILTDVEARMKGNAQSAAPKSEVQSSVQTKAATEVSVVNVSHQTESLASSSQAGFPIASTDQGVTMSVRSAYEHDGELVLEVSLQNSGSQTVQFLYSFMDVTDNQGRMMSANTQGLPAELPPNNEKYSGVVSIPSAVLDGVDSVALSLPDYPDQQLTLRLSGIPVER